MIILILAVAIPIFATMLVFAVAKAVELHTQRTDYGWYFRIPVLVLMGLGFAASVLFNATVASVLFLESPHELLFADRVRRKAKEGDAQGLEWRERINRLIPKHV